METLGGMLMRYRSDDLIKEKKAYFRIMAMNKKKAYFRKMAKNKMASTIKDFETYLKTKMQKVNMMKTCNLCNESYIFT